MDLSPVTSELRLVEGLTTFLALPSLPSAGHVVSLDLQEVSLDLSSVPLDEVLEFRDEHGESFRAYRRNLRRFLRELSMTPEGDRTALLAERQEEISDEANDLRRRCRNRWIRPMGKASLSVAGGAWNLATGDPVGAALAFGAALLEAPERAVSAYSYLFELERSFRSR